MNFYRILVSFLCFSILQINIHAADQGSDGFDENSAELSSTEEADWFNYEFPQAKLIKKDDDTGQDIGPRSSKKRSFSEFDLSQESSPAKRKKKIDAIDSQNLDLIQRDNLLVLDSIKQELCNANEPKSLDTIQEYMRVIGTRKQMAAHLPIEDSKKLTGMCDDLKDMLLWQKNCREYPHTFFSNPKDRKETKLSAYLTGLIHHAKDEIKAACFHLTFFPVAQALVARKKAGVAVTVLTNEKQGGPASAVQEMKREGIDIMVPRGMYYQKFLSMHAKFFIFKNVLGKKIVVTGSYNPTGSADENEWNDLHISDFPKTWAQYMKQFNTMKSAFEPAKDFVGKFEELRADNDWNAKNYDKNNKLRFTYDLNLVPQENRRFFELHVNPVGPANRIQPDTE